MGASNDEDADSLHHNGDAVDTTRRLPGLEAARLRRVAVAGQDEENHQVAGLDWIGRGDRPPYPYR